MAHLCLPVVLSAQFLDAFEDESVAEWDYFTGDGDARMRFEPMTGFARITVDAREDAHNVWWAIIKRDVAPFLDLERLGAPDYELRVEARVRVSDAPRRLNIMINTQRTTDFHEHLMEYDIATSDAWHDISLTTKALDVVPGDSLFVQLGVTDWGRGEYAVDVDSYRAEVVRAAEAPADLGEPLLYHPPLPAREDFEYRLRVDHDSLVHRGFPEVNFADWAAIDGEGRVPVLTLNPEQWAVLRWDLSDLAGSRAAGIGVLELSTHSLFDGGGYSAVYGEDLGMEFGKIRVIEILGGDPDWDEASVSYRSLTGGAGYEAVFNSQMTIDIELAPEPGAKTRIPLSRPVMQRLLDGRTKGLLIRPLGAIVPSIHAAEAGEERAPRLYFNTVE